MNAEASSCPIRNLVHYVGREIAARGFYIVHLIKGTATHLGHSLSFRPLTRLSLKEQQTPKGGVRKYRKVIERCRFLQKSTRDD